MSTDVGRLDGNPMPLAERITVLGRSWVEHVCESLRREGRRPAGMWPGTLSEARVLVDRVFHQDRDSSTAADRERVAHDLYAAARKVWRASREHDATDDD
jgi:hypothetical protein